MPLVTKPLAVEEFVGLYGPYQVSELVLQRIWLESAFDVSRLVDDLGRPVRIESPGVWNRLEGPDFKGAVLRIGGACVEGDVEIHFGERNWNEHGHQRDPNYDNVILHVVYHPLDARKRVPAQNARGELIPTVSLLPMLWYSLEEYASDDSIVGSTGVEPLPEVQRLIALDVASRRRELVELAEERWELKMHFAQQRIDKLGWTNACHQTALEILGYSKNRIPMLLVGGSFSLRDFASGRVALKDAWLAGREKWRSTGSRPANHPRTRLLQYIDWTQERPDWPSALQRLFPEFAKRAEAAGTIGAMGSADERKRVGVLSLSRQIGRYVLGEAISGTRATTLAVDGFLPLLAAESGMDFFHLWFHWAAGDGPESCVDALQRLQVLSPRVMPSCNGWLQGTLALRSRARI